MPAHRLARNGPFVRMASRLSTRSAAPAVDDADGIQHILLTRLNLNRGFGAPDGRAITPAWLDHRLQLFEGLALPAIRSQTSRDFLWLLMASDETPEPYRSRIESYADGEQTFVHIVGEYDERLPSALVAQHLDASADRLLTSRLDNDDVVSRDFLQRVRVEARRHRHGFLNWDRGYQFDLASGRLYELAGPSNPFISLIEPIDDGTPLLTTLGVIHSRAGEVLPVHRIKERRSWIQIIHDQNLSNALGANRRVSRRVLRRFSAPLLQSTPRDKVMDLTTERVLWEWRRIRRRVRRTLQR